MSAAVLVPLVPLVTDADDLLAVHADCLDASRRDFPSLFAGEVPAFAEVCASIFPVPDDAVCCRARQCLHAPLSPYLGWDS